MGVPLLKGFLVALVKLKEDGLNPWNKLRYNRQTFDYLMGDISGLIPNLVSDLGEFVSYTRGGLKFFENDII